MACLVAYLTRGRGVKWVLMQNQGLMQNQKTRVREQLALILATIVF
jgi:hypothetical protein